MKKPVKDAEVNQKGRIETKKRSWAVELYLDLVLGGLVDVLLVEGHEGLGDSLTDGVDLGNTANRERGSGREVRSERLGRAGAREI